MPFKIIINPRFFTKARVILIRSWMNLNTIPDQRRSRSEGHLQTIQCFFAPTEELIFDQIVPAGQDSIS